MFIFAGYVSILGRSKDLVISGGLNVYPKEVEDVLDKLQGVSESTIIGCPHKDLGEGVIAVTVPTNAPKTEEEQKNMESDFIQQLKEKLAGYKVSFLSFF